MLAFVFPGQGSQAKGMGGTLFDEIDEYRRLEPEVDRLLGYSARRLCLDGPFERLTDTRNTQPCLYVVNALHYFQAARQGERPVLMAGHSVGEYNALLAAGAFDFMTGLRLVQQRGELMSRARQGGMGAVLGLDATLVPSVLAANGLTSLDVANYNSPTQTVVSGPVADIARARVPFETAGARMFMPLPVSGAFHSRYMADFARAFADILATVKFSPLMIPVIANVTGQPYPTDDPTTTIRSMLTRQITSSVRWTDTIRYAIAHGVTQFREIGPGMTLTKLIKDIQQPAVAAPAQAAPARAAAAPLGRP
jgi:malonyl CoA-acyl carrier protein transacylase